jgi:hypothetical protein
MSIFYYVLEFRSKRKFTLQKDQIQLQSNGVGVPHPRAQIARPYFIFILLQNKLIYIIWASI